MLDGGVAANNPDTLILPEFAKPWLGRFARTQMLDAAKTTARAAYRSNRTFLDRVLPQHPGRVAKA